MSESPAAAVQVLKKSFQDQIGELLECPNCLEQPVGSIVLCIAGHHSCMECRTKYSECGVCRRAWSENGRNYLAESLRDKLQDIQQALFPAEEVVSMKNCRIEGCVTASTPDKMIYHILQKHIRQLIQWEHEVTNDTHHTVLNLLYRRGMQYDFAGAVGDFGVLFVNIWMTNHGPINVVLKAVQKVQEETEYYVHLELPNEQPLELSSNIRTYSDNEEIFCGALQFDQNLFINMQDLKPLLLRIYITTPVKVDMAEPNA